MKRMRGRVKAKQKVHHGVLRSMIIFHSVETRKFQLNSSFSFDTINCNEEDDQSPSEFWFDFQFKMNFSTILEHIDSVGDLTIAKINTP